MARPFNPSKLAFTGEASPVVENTGTSADNPYVTASETGLLAYRHGFDRGTLQLSWYDRAGKVLESVAKPGPYLSLALSPDGTRVAFSQASGAAPDIWVHEFARGSAARLTFDKAAELMPCWSTNPPASTRPPSSRSHTAAPVTKRCS